MDSLVDPLAEFSVNLLKQAAKEKAGENVFMSPLSVQVALAMAYAGADTETKQQMNNTLFKGLSDAQVHTAMQSAVQLLTPDASQGHKLATANRIYCMQGCQLLAEFNAIVSKHYSSDVQQVNFADNEAVAGQINAWVEQQTNGKIQNLVPAAVLNALTRLVLVNAIYFKGDWRNKFDEADTYKQNFYCTPEKKVQVDMMHQKDKFLYGDHADVQVLGLPYKNEDLKMFILLPKERFGLTKLLESLDGKKLIEYISQVRQQKVEVSLPKFKVESSFQLNDSLKALGCDKMFSEGEADFTKMLQGLDKKGDLCVSAILHKAFLEVNEEGSEAAAATAAVVRTKRSRPPATPVNEEGSEAAAATAVVMMTRCAMVNPQPDPEVTVDHPFLAVIAHTKPHAVPLFVGSFTSVL